MATPLLHLLLAACLLLVTADPIRKVTTNGTLPLVMWHGMGMCLGPGMLGQSDI